MRVSLLIPKRGRHERLPVCLHYLAAANAAGRHAVVVTILDDSPGPAAPDQAAFPQLQLRYLHQAAAPGAPFSRAALLNAGIAAPGSRWDWCGIIDIDMLYGPNLYDRVAEAVGGGYVCLRGGALDAAQTAAVFARRPPFAELMALRPEPLSGQSQIAFTPAWLARYRTVFGTPTLFDRRFIGWGYEDTVPDMAANLLARAGLAAKAVLADAWLHLDHPRAPTSQLSDQNLALACAIHAEQQARLQAYLREHGPPRPALPLIDCGAALLAEGRFDEAEAHLRAAVALAPQDPDAAPLLAVLLGRRGASAEAVTLLQQALVHSPGEPALHLNLGEALRRQGRLGQARMAFEQALWLNPYFPEARYNLGTLCRQEGRDEEAAQQFAEAARMRPGYAAAHYNRANTLRELGRLEQAVGSYEAALRARPGYAEAHLNLGAALQELEQTGAAEAQYARAAALQPALPAAQRNLAQLYERQGRLAEARAAGARALALDPDNDLLRLSIETSLAPIAASVEAIEQGRAELARTIETWRSRGLRVDRARVAESGGAAPFALIYQGRDDRQLREAYADLFSAAFSDEPPPRGGGRPRLGFVVTGGHEGVFLKCMAGLIAGLPPGPLQVGVACGRRVAPHMRALVGRPDLDVVPLPNRLDLAAAALRAARFDMLIFWEIGTDSLNYFLPLCRCAPVQCATWGWPITSGMSAITQFISSARLEPPGAERFYSERLVRLPSLPTCYKRPPVPPTPPRTQFGLHADQHFYLCAQNLRKVHPDLDPLIATILRSDPHAQMRFVADREPGITALLQARLRAAMPDVAERVGFLPRMAEADYLGLVAACDVLLDTPHYGGGANTCFDAAAAATPLVTLPGAQQRGRWAMAVAAAIGVPDGVAATPDEYVARALALGTDPAYRAAVSARIRAAAPALFERPEPAQELAAFVLATLA